MVTIAIILAWLGLCAGSFINALVWRVHEQGKPKKGKTKTNSLSIINGRSVCENCGHQLAWYDLIPVISWLWLRGKCRYCGKPVSIQNPLVELLTALVFAGSYVFWPHTAHLNGQWLLLAVWLVSAIGLIALAVYDIRWMLLPNKIIYPALAAAASGRAIYIGIYDPKPLHALLLWAASLVIASGVFFVLFVYSKGKWIGYGDVRLGLITGTLLADPGKSLAMIFLSSVIGTLVILPGLIGGTKKLATRLPYGPFLITATAILVVFGDSFINWYKNLFGL